MKFSSLMKVGLFSVVSIFCANQSFASTVKIDLAGTITNTYILNVANGNTTWEDSALWDIGSGLPVGSALNVRTSYNTNAPSNWHQTDGVNSTDQYEGLGFSVSAPAFQAFSPNSSVGIGNGLYTGWDFLSSGFRAPDNTGIKINFQNEIYYFIAGSVMMVDESGTAFGSSSLPTDQSSLDAFWLNNSQSNIYGGHVAVFDLEFAKDPLANSFANNTWPNGEALYVTGYFDVAKLTKVDAPEPTGLLLLFMGMAGLVVRRFGITKR